MQSLDEIKNSLLEQLEAKPMLTDLDHWYHCIDAVNHSNYVPLQFKPGFIQYQAEYFKDVYHDYMDISMVLYRGGRAIGIWSICVYINNDTICFGSAGMALMGPLFSDLPKTEAQRAVIENCLKTLFFILDTNGGGYLLCNETILDNGASQWIRKLLEHGATEQNPKFQAFVDLNLSHEEIQSRIRRTNKYSIAKGQDTYDIEIYDELSEPVIDQVFEEFHDMHRKVAGRETRGQSTWDMQKKIVQEGSAERGKSFLIFIRDKETKELAGAALFDCTPQTGLYCVAAYDRSRFSKPVGHIVQAVAMERMREMGIRWYEIGERAYPGDKDSNEKLVDIGHYKEGFATHFFPRVFVTLDSETFHKNVLN